MDARKFSAFRRFGIAAALLSAAAVMPASADDCTAVGADAAAVAGVIVSTVQADPDAVAGVLACAQRNLPEVEFRTAVSLAAAQIPNERLAMLVIELGAELMLSNAPVVPDPRLSLETAIIIDPSTSAF